MSEVYGLSTNSLVNPIGIDRDIYFSWKLKSDRNAVYQTGYRIEISATADFADIVFDTNKVISDKSINVYIDYKFKPSARYYWRVTVYDNYGEEVTSDTAFFETGLMGTDKSVWSGAEWITAPYKLANPNGVTSYKISMDFTASQIGSTELVLAARNKDNYISVEINMPNRKVMIYDYSDNKWDGENSSPTVMMIGSAAGYDISKKAVPDGSEYAVNNIVAEMNGNRLKLDINNVTLIDEEIIANPKPHHPMKAAMFNWGIKQLRGRAEFGKISVFAEIDGEMHLVQESDFSDSNTAMSVLGDIQNGRLIAENEFNIICAMPSMNFRKLFSSSKEIKSARVYSSARGFYDLYVNGQKVNTDFYNPGFTDYRKRIQYQTYDVSEFIRIGDNSIGAVVAKGYYTGHVGYSPSMIYGKQNSFIAKLVIMYSDNSADVIVTDDTWQFTSMGSTQDADYMHGERCDARLGFDWNDKNDGRWSVCGVAEWQKSPQPTNGTLNNVEFELSAQVGATAQVERVLTPICDVYEMPKGHFVYDMGQNMVGTVRLRLKGRCGTSIKLRYGEMRYKSGEVYLQNLRTAYNTDVYVFSGNADVEVFVPTFAQHGFRYIEITGENIELTRDDIDKMVLSVEGLVLANTNVLTGEFECSDKLVNKLQKNIEWGQRGNSLLVYTDCPQRNERMGWTGDAQVFAKTAAYNMDVRAFMDKWLLDLRDGQLMYNKDGAVPDTAPLGGDNRPDGCAGWADAAVIVPWEMYLAYGDEKILEENYEMMSAWVDYQSCDDRQNYGMRIVDGVEVPEKSDLAKIPYIQVQQRRGDHLSFDVSTPYIYSATAYAAYVAGIMAKIAEILGKKEDCEKYRIRYENVKRAFCEAWIKEDGSVAYWGEVSGKTPQGIKPTALDGSTPYNTYYSDLENSEHHPSQTAYALALDFELIPPEKRTRAIKCYKDTIERNNNRLSVGFLGISHLASALTKSGLSDTAYKLLQQEEFPSWLYSVKNGATTIWERWNSYIAETDTFGDIAMNSFNHYSYGAIGEWLFNTVVGINTSDEKGRVGYKHIILKPCIGGSLKWAKGNYNSCYGEIVSEWKIKGGRVIYHCEIPANTSAEVHIPTDKYDSVCVLGGYKSKVVDGCAVYQLDNGKYTFEFER